MNDIYEYDDDEIDHMNNNESIKEVIMLSMVLFGLLSLSTIIICIVMSKDGLNNLSNVLNVRMNTFFDFEKYEKELGAKKSTFNQNLLEDYNNISVYSIMFFIALTVILFIILISIYMIYIHVMMKYALEIEVRGNIEVDGSSPMDKNRNNFGRRRYNNISVKRKIRR